MLRHEPIEGTNRRRFYQPRGVPRLGWVDLPEGMHEEQYWAPEHPNQPSVQVRLPAGCWKSCPKLATCISSRRTCAQEFLHVCVQPLARVSYVCLEFVCFWVFILSSWFDLFWTDQGWVMRPFAQTNAHMGQTFKVVNIDFRIF